MLKVVKAKGLIERFGDCKVSGGFTIRCKGVFRPVEKQVTRYHMYAKCLCLLNLTLFLSQTQKCKKMMPAASLMFKVNFHSRFCSKGCNSPLEKHSKVAKHVNIEI